MELPSRAKTEAIALLLVLGTMPCLARLGETVPESTARYGVPISTVTKTADCQELTYAKNGMVLIGKFFKGVCVGLQIEKKAEISSPRELPLFSDTKQFENAEVKELLEQNSQAINGMAAQRSPPTGKAASTTATMAQPPSGNLKKV